MIELSKETALESAFSSTRRNLHALTSLSLFPNKKGFIENRVFPIDGFKVCFGCLSPKYAGPDCEVITECLASTADINIGEKESAKEVNGYWRERVSLLGVSSSFHAPLFSSPATLCNQLT